MADRWVDVTSIRALRRKNRARAYAIGDSSLLICNLDGALHAIADTCTHDGGRLGEGRLRGTTVRCPRHGARFDVRDGSVQAPPACRPVAVYPVRVVDDRVQVALPDVSGGAAPPGHDGPGDERGATR